MRQRVLVSRTLAAAPESEFEVAYWNGSIWIGATGTGEVHGVYAWAEVAPPERPAHPRESGERLNRGPHAEEPN